MTLVKTRRSVGHRETKVGQIGSDDAPSMKIGGVSLFAQ